MWKALCNDSFSCSKTEGKRGSRCTDLRHIQSSPHLSCTEAILGGEELGGEEKKSIQGKVCYRWAAEVKGLLVLYSRWYTGTKSVSQAHHSSASAHPKSFQTSGGGRWRQTADLDIGTRSERASSWSLSRDEALMEGRLVRQDVRLSLQYNHFQCNTYCFYYYYYHFYNVFYII